MHLGLPDSVRNFSGPGPYHPIVEAGETDIGSLTPRRLKPETTQIALEGQDPIPLKRLKTGQDGLHHVAGEFRRCDIISAWEWTGRLETQSMIVNRRMISGIDKRGRAAQDRDSFRVRCALVLCYELRYIRSLKHNQDGTGHLDTFL